MKNDQAFRAVREMLSANRDTIETFHGVLNRFRVAALNHVLDLAEPQYRCVRRGSQLLVYQRVPMSSHGGAKYKRLAGMKLIAR